MFNSYVKLPEGIDGIHVIPYMAAPWIRHGIWSYVCQFDPMTHSQGHLLPIAFGMLLLGVECPNLKTTLSSLMRSTVFERRIRHGTMDHGDSSKMKPHGTSAVDQAQNTSHAFCCCRISCGCQQHPYEACDRSIGFNWLIMLITESVLTGLLGCSERHQNC